VNTVHDSIVIDVHPEEEQQVLYIIKSVNTDMKSIIDREYNIDFNIPLLLEAKMGNNWLDTKEVS
jgi:DNA polymerase I-like protein with 3'-5' exonuclease and polymerase domains